VAIKPRYKPGGMNAIGSVGGVGAGLGLLDMLGVAGGALGPVGAVLQGAALLGGLFGLGKEDEPTWRETMRPVQTRNILPQLQEQSGKYRRRPRESRLSYYL